METYKFETVILEDGMIHIPEISRYAESRVEISVVIRNEKEKAEPTEKMTMKAFLEKWTGLIKNEDPDEAKFGYLQGKYE